MSRMTSAAEKNYYNYELEVLAIVKALKKFCIYPLGKHLKIVTDRDTFKMTMNKRDLSTQTAKFNILLDNFVNH